MAVLPLTLLHHSSSPTGTSRVPFQPLPHGRLAPHSPPPLLLPHRHQSSALPATPSWPSCPSLSSTTPPPPQAPVECPSSHSLMAVLPLTLLHHSSSPTGTSRVPFQPLPHGRLAPPSPPPPPLPHRHQSSAPPATPSWPSCPSLSSTTLPPPQAPVECPS